MNKRFLLRNTQSALINQIITVIYGFIIPNIILSTFGSEVNGLVSSITQYLGFISILDLGVGAVIQTAYYEPIANNNYVKVGLILKESKIFFKRIAIILVVYVLVLCFYFTRLSNNMFDDYYTIALVLSISLSTFAQYYYSIPYDLLINAEQRYYYQSNIQVVLVVVNIIASLIMVNLGYSIQTVKLVNSIIFLAKPILTITYVRKNLDIYTPGKKERIIIDQKWNGMAQHIAAVLMNNMDTILITSFSTFVAVSVYSVYNMVLVGVRTLLSSVSNGFSSYLGDMYARDETVTLKKRFEIYEWLYHTIITVVFSCTLLLIVPFVGLYTSNVSDNSVYIQYEFAKVITIAHAIYCIRIPYNTMVCSAGHFRQTQGSAIIEVVINLGISVLLIFKLGLVGVAWGTLIAISYRTIFFIVYLERNIVGLDIKNTANLLLVDLLSAIAINYTCKGLWVRIENGITSWVLSAMLYMVISITVVFIVNIICRKNYIHELLIMLKKS